MHDYNFEEESANCEPQNMQFIQNKQLTLQKELNF